MMDQPEKQGKIHRKMLKAMQLSGYVEALWVRFHCAESHQIKQ